MKNWRTTLAGIAMILSSVVNVVSFGKPISMETITNVIAGVGLLTAKDAAKKDEPAVPPASMSASAGK